MAAPVLLLSIGAFGGWVAREKAALTECAYTAEGYKRLTDDPAKLAKHPLENVSQQALGDIQRCWAAHPYAGPQHALELVDARKLPTGGYYAIFDPSGIADVQLVFRVDRSGKVAQAFQHGTS